MSTRLVRCVPVLLLALLTASAPAQPAPTAAPLNYAPAQAYHNLQETHNNESGYSSLCEGADGSIYIGTAKYGVNAYLVEFDPRKEAQRIVLDTHKVCGLSAVGYAAQSKIHTPNFVGPSGKIYVGSKQGYPDENDKKNNTTYPGGYVMTYDPRTGVAENLGMPYPKAPDMKEGEGVIDVVADEDRGLLYVVTCETQHWMVYTTATKKYAEPDPQLRLANYATTLIDSRGIASAIAVAPTDAAEVEKGFKPQQFRLAQYDPSTGKVTTRDLELDGRKWVRTSGSAIPQWSLAPDGRTAWLIQLTDATLISIDLHAAGPAVPAKSRGKLIQGENIDIRSGLAFHPDGRIYAIASTANKTGFGPGGLAHLARFDPRTNQAEDLGVVSVSNPEFYGPASTGPDGKKKQWSHGFVELPDKTLAAIYNLGLRATRDGTLYATQLYPFTLLRFEQFKVPAPAATPAADYLAALVKECDRAEARLPEFTRVAEVVARRHLAGGALGFVWTHSGLADELIGRSGGMVNTGFDRVWTQDRTDAQKANDVVIAGWNRPPGDSDLAQLKKEKARGCYLIGFGPRSLPELAEHVKLCDAFFDTGVADDRAVSLGAAGRGGRLNTFINTIHGWAFTGELVAALTRQGKMPAMWMSYGLPEGKDWGNRYLHKKQFHDDYQVGPQPAGSLGKAYLAAVRYHLRAMASTQLPAIQKAGELLAAEIGSGKKVCVGWTGHMPPGYLGKFDDKPWADVHETHMFIPSQAEAWRRGTPDGALVIALGYTGLSEAEAAVYRDKKQRVILVSGDHPDPGNRAYKDLLVRVYDFAAWGDAVVPLESYPIRILPVTGFAQLAAYEAIGVEAAARLAGAK